ncbi:MAG: ABC transporter ATP-binding protein, partial [Eubacterium sp.]|nr:ABC transporter ATP-binding protein [Eubacterium sp.]
MKMIEVTDLCKTYGVKNEPVHAVNHITLSIEEGTVNALTGKSGSGKSTLLRLLGLQEMQDSGIIRLNGREINSDDEERSAFRLRNIGFIWQDYKLIHEYTIRDNILIPCRLADSKCDKRYFEGLIRLLDIEGILDKYPLQCSGGQQQRAAIARAFILKPGIVLADEATGNLDSKNAETVFRMFEDAARKTKTTVLFGTHDQTLAH